MNHIIRFYSGASSYTGPLTIWQLVQYSVIKTFGLGATRPSVFDIEDTLVSELDRSLSAEGGAKRRRRSLKKIDI